MKRVLLAISGCLLLTGFSGCGYNSLQGLDEDVKASWSEVQNQYQRRSDLIPNLVNVVKGYAKHEQETLEKVVQARAEATKTTLDVSKLSDKQSFEKFQQAQGQLSSALGKLMVVVEKYPDLKANENFRDLQSQLEGTENRITVERMRFNEAAQQFNTLRRTIPTAMVAGFFGFKEKAYFKASECPVKEWIRAGTEIGVYQIRPPICQVSDYLKVSP